MSLATLSSEDLSRIQKLVERKEALARQIAEINIELEAIELGAPAAASFENTASRPAAPSKPAKGARSAVRAKGRQAGRTVPGGLKERISSELQAAGKDGMRVKDLAAKLGASYGNITSFFQGTGKKMKEIKKVGRGQFAWVA
jgi:hypothetical protein